LYTAAARQLLPLAPTPNNNNNKDYNRNEKFKGIVHEIFTNTRTELYYIKGENRLKAAGVLYRARPYSTMHVVVIVAVFVVVVVSAGLTNLPHGSRF
jgi:hypothetical protein